MHRQANMIPTSLWQGLILMHVKVLLIFFACIFWVCTSCSFCIKITQLLDHTNQNGRSDSISI